MKILYGTSIPPGLQAPTRGELRARVSSLVLDADQISRYLMTPSGQPLHRAVPVDHCSLSLRFWGEPLEGPGSLGSASCIPPTPAHPERGTTTIVFPVKTLPEQCKQYLTHMTLSAQRGVRLFVYVSTQVSGGKSIIPVGFATVSLAALSDPTATVQGWFEVRARTPLRHGNDDNNNDGITTTSLPNANDNSDDPNDNTKFVTIGRVKVSFSLVFFPEPASGSAAAVAPKRGGDHLHPNETAHSTDHSSGGGAQPKGQKTTPAGLVDSPPVMTPPPPPPPPPPPAPTTTSAVANQNGNHKGGPVATATSVQQQAAPSVPQAANHNATADARRAVPETTSPAEQPPAAAVSADGGTNGGSLDLQDAKVRDWFHRGLQLRNEMARVASVSRDTAVAMLTTLPSSVPVRVDPLAILARSSVPHHNETSGAHPAPGTNNGMPLNLNLRRGVTSYHSAVAAGGGGGGSDSSSVSSSSVSSSDDEGEEESDDEMQPKSVPASAQPISAGPRKQQQQQYQHNSQLPRVPLRGAPLLVATQRQTTVILRLRWLSFAANSRFHAGNVTHIRFSIKLSVDMTLSTPPMESYSSYVHDISSSSSAASSPLSICCVIPNIVQYTPGVSQLVIEALSVHPLSRAAGAEAGNDDENGGDGSALRAEEYFPFTLRDPLVEQRKRAARPFVVQRISSETLLGVAALGCFSQAAHLVPFTNPLWNESPIQVQAEVEVRHDDDAAMDRVLDTIVGTQGGEFRMVEGYAIPLASSTAKPEGAPPPPTALRFAKPAVQPTQQVRQEQDANPKQNRSESAATRVTSRRSSRRRHRHHSRRHRRRRHHSPSSSSSRSASSTTSSFSGSTTSSSSYDSDVSSNSRSSSDGSRHRRRHVQTTQRTADNPPPADTVATVALPSPVAKSSSSSVVTETSRLHLSIVEGKGFPFIHAASTSSSSASSQEDPSKPVVVTGTGITEDSLGRRYVEPSLLLVLEDFFEDAVHPRRLHESEPRAVEDWVVDASVNGLESTSCVSLPPHAAAPGGTLPPSSSSSPPAAAVPRHAVPFSSAVKYHTVRTAHTTTPVFLYECIVSRSMTTAVRVNATSDAVPSSSSTSSSPLPSTRSPLASPMGPPPTLTANNTSPAAPNAATCAVSSTMGSKLFATTARIGVYHVPIAANGTATEGGPVVPWWTSCAKVGSCDVDLRMLKHFPRTEGWFAVQPSDPDSVVKRPVGYLHVAVCVL